MLYQFLEKKVSRKLYIGASVILLIVGYLWWNISIAIALLVMVLPFVSKCYELKKKRTVSRYRSVLIAFVIIMASTVSLKVLDYTFIRSDKKIQEYVSYIETWQFIENLGWPDYDDSQAMYEELDGQHFRNIRFHPHVSITLF